MSRVAEELSFDGTGMITARYECRRDWQFDQWLLFRAKNVLKAPGSCSQGEPMIELAESWTSWREGVVTVIRHEFQDIFDHIEDADIDWEAWRPLFEEGRSPTAAVDRAFLRDVAR